MKTTLAMSYTTSTLPSTTSDFLSQTSLAGTTMTILLQPGKYTDMRLNTNHQLKTHLPLAHLLLHHLGNHNTVGGVFITELSELSWT